MLDFSNTVAHYNDAFATALLVFIEDSMIAIIVFLLWVFIFLRVMRPFRLTAQGDQKDNSLFVMGLAIFLALSCAIMTMGIFIDIKISMFGAFKGSIIKGLFLS